MIMRRIIVTFISCIITVFNVMAEIWYYIPAGKNPESYDGYVDIVIRDNRGDLWFYSTTAYSLKNNLLKDNNYYINLFNNATFGVNSFVNKRYMNSYKGVSFTNLIFNKRETKCIIYEYNFFEPNIRINLLAFSLDFNTMIKDPDKVDPRYYTSCSVNNFIVRKSINDLF